MTKKEIRAAVDAGNWPQSPFKLGREWVCLGKTFERGGSKKAFYMVKYGNCEATGCYSLTELIDYLYKKVNNKS